MAAYERTLKLSNRKRKQLTWHRDHDPRPYVRERSAALLKIGDGETAHRVAQGGLLKPRDADTVYQWLDWYAADGFAALSAHAPGGYRGARVDAHRAEVTERLQQPPAHGPEPAPAAEVAPAPCRWTLAVVRAHFDWLADYTLAGVWRVLGKLDIHWQHGYVRQWSPDPDYVDKLHYIEQCLRRVARDPIRYAVVFLDEMGYYRWPSPAHDWIADDAGYPVAHHGACNNQQWRVIGALNAYSGRVTYLQNYIVGREQVIQFQQQLHDHYRRVETLYAVQDNWNVHTHPDVNTALDALPRLERVWLPTYASWLNPIEKLWRWTRQRVLHLHRLSEQWPALRQRVASCFDQFANGSTALLRYVGLLGDGRFAKILQP